MLPAAPVLVTWLLENGFVLLLVAVAFLLELFEALEIGLQAPTGEDKRISSDF